MRHAPGTWGSLPPVILTFILAGCGAPGWIINTVLLLALVVFSWSCIQFGTWAEKHFQGKDPKQVVADETAGVSIALLFLPWSMQITSQPWLSHLLMVGIAFVAFRIFDVIKPPPIYQCQRFKAGWGILADDLIAGFFALIITQIVSRLIFPVM